MPSPLTEAWAGQHQVYPGDSWARDMWNSWLDPQRIVLVKAIQKVVETPSSILEVGCGSGPNLRLWRAQWPSADLTGVDVNDTALGWGQRQAAEEGWFWDAYRRRLTETEGDWGLLRHDVVVSCYTLTYLTPDEINPVLQQLLRLTRNALVIMEPMVAHGTPEYHYGGKPGGQRGYPEFWYDYPTRFKEILKGTDQSVECSVEPMVPHGHLNGVVTIKPTGSDASNTSHNTGVVS